MPPCDINLDTIETVRSMGIPNVDEWTVMNACDVGGLGVLC